MSELKHKEANSRCRRQIGGDKDGKRLILFATKCEMIGSKEEGHCYDSDLRDEAERFFRIAGKPREREREREQRRSQKPLHTNLRRETPKTLRRFRFDSIE